MKKNPITFVFHAPIVTLDQLFIVLTQHAHIYERVARTATGYPKRWRITSIKRGKRNPNQFRIGIKHAMYEFNEITTLEEFNRYFAVAYQYDVNGKTIYEGRRDDSLEFPTAAVAQ